jgi:hypothetical protein
MKNIHVLPTDKPSKLRVHECGQLFLSINFIYEINDENKKHIYITFDEEIKDGDYALQFHYGKISIVKCDSQNKSVINNKSLDLYATKIILTTNQDLIKDSVQSIDDEFLEWFVKNPSCEEVETFKVWWSDDSYSYEIVIPKEDWLLNNPHCKQIESCSKSLSKKCICPKEEPKQETLEEYTSQDFLNEVYWNNPKQKTLEEKHTDILEVGQILINEETLEYGLLQHIKMCLECNNESQAIRLLEKYGFEKQEERYSEEEIMDMFHSLSMHLPLHYEFLVKEQFKK